MDKLRTALDRFALAEKAYREKYGEESLDRVIYCDPLNISAEEANRAAKTLEMAVRDVKAQYGSQQQLHTLLDQQLS